jgi:23S rRNA (cytidine2498-2'-O)-methyltransferase
MDRPAALVGYLAPEGFLPDLTAELGDGAREIYGRLVLSPDPGRPIAWAANVWFEPQQIAISSIGDAAKKLRAIQRNWALYAHAYHRRAALIADKLPKVSAKPSIFGEPAPAALLGSWTLIAPDLIVASPRCSSPFLNGEVHFVEDRIEPPSRAYLKLWELFTLLGQRPNAGDFCIDLGSSPGGWTWVLQKLGARVLSVDKAPLDPRVDVLAGVDHRQVSAFALEPRSAGPADWLFSDVICYPRRLLALVKAWLESGMARRFVCTIKFQGESDFEVMSEFAAIPGSRLLHLHHNKHELTWVHL